MSSATSTVYVLNGPNLNLLGKRQPEIYGHETMADVERACAAKGDALGLTVAFHQSNHEGEIVETIHRARDEAAAIVINPAAYTHTSVAIMDALLAFDGPVIEVHLSNVHRREEFRNHSYVSKAATGVICGLGSRGYLLALDAVADLIAPDAGDSEG